MGSPLECWRLGYWLKWRELQVFSWWWRLSPKGNNDWAESYVDACRASDWVSRNWAGEEVFLLRLCFFRLDQDRTFQKGGW